jgi:hypothetical protein
MSGWREILGIVFGAPFWKDVKFYFAVINAIAVFAPRFGLQLTLQELGAINLVIAVAFGVTPPTIQYMQLKNYEANVKRMEMAQAKGAQR